MENFKSLSLKAGLLLCAPLMFAFEGVSFGAEVGAGIVDSSYGAQVAGATNGAIAATIPTT